MKMATKKIKLEMTLKEFDAFFCMAEENALAIGASGDGSTEGDEFLKVNTKRVVIINKVLKKNGINRSISY